MYGEISGKTTYKEFYWKCLEDIYNCGFIIGTEDWITLQIILMQYHIIHIIMSGV